MNPEIWIMRAAYLNVSHILPKPFTVIVYFEHGYFLEYMFITIYSI